MSDNTNTDPMEQLTQQAEDIRKEIMAVMMQTVPSGLIQSMHDLMTEYALIHFQRGATMVTLINTVDGE